MARIDRFEEIESWRNAKALCLEIYSLLAANRDFSFNDQLKRASISIMNNIAEGFERQSNKEFKQFLYIAKGSAGEVRSMVLLGKELGYFTEDVSRELEDRVVTISKLIAGLIKRL